MTRFLPVFTSLITKLRAYAAITFVSIAIGSANAAIVFNDDFNGAALDTNKWTKYNWQGSVGVVVVANGTAHFPSQTAATTCGKYTFTGTGGIVVESRMGGFGVNRDSWLQLMEVNSGDFVAAGDSDFWGGLYSGATGQFAVSVGGVGGSVATMSEYRMTLNGTTLRIERGATLANITHSRTITLPSSVDGKTFFLRIGTGGPEYQPADFEWVRVDATAVAVNSNCNSEGGVTPIPTYTLTIPASASLGVNFTNPLGNAPATCALTATGTWNNGPTATYGPQGAVSLPVCGVGCKFPNSPSVSLNMLRYNGSYQYIGESSTVSLVPNETVSFANNDGIASYADNNGSVQVVLTCTEQIIAINGTCGTANGVAVATAPTANLCATGTANPATLTGPGPWSWTCDGIAGGTNAPCSASRPAVQNAASINSSASGTRTHADPIIVASGAHSISLPLLNVQGRVPLGFAISYSSLSPSTDTGAGFGWTHRYGATLNRVDSVTAAVQWPNGRVTRYQKAGVTWYPQAADANDKLVENVDGSWVLTDAALTKHEFSSTGALQKQTSRSGVVLNFTYAGGKLTTVTDPVSGRSLSFTWNAGNRIASVTAPGGQSAQLAYDAAGNLVSATNGAGGTVTYTYDVGHRVLTGTNELGEQFFANTYDAQGRVIGQDDGVIASPTTGLAYTASAAGFKTVVTDRNAKSATYEFDTQYRETKATDATGAVVAKTYDVNGNVLTQTDANGKVTATTYDARNNPLTVTDAAGRTVTMTYDSNDNMLTLTDAAGSTTTFTYDASNRLLTRKNALDQTTTYAYNASGQVTQVTLPSGATITSTYAAGQLATMTDATGNTTGFAYDANGQATSVTDAAGGVTTFTYDGMGRVLTTTNPLGHVVTNAYDARGRLLTRTDARGNATTYAYNANDKHVSITNALGQITTMTYDYEDRVTGLTDARGNTTTFAYNARGDQTTITDALGRAVTKTIDPAGIVTAITNGAGNTASFTFDNSYALATSADGLANTTTLTRDTAARVTRSTDPLGRQTNFTYDALSRLASTTDALAGIASQSFDANGNLASMTDQRGNTTAFAFDAQGRMLSITTPEGSVVSSTYTPRGQFATITNARGQVATFTYDAAGRVTQRSDATGTITYTYDANGNPLTVSDSVGTITRVFDALNRVTSYTTAHGKTMGYQYDAAGNLTRITYPDSKQVNYTYNAANQMATVTDWANRVTTYAYDTAGRLNAITNSNGTTVAMTYDAAGRLTAYTDTVNANSYVYDAVGNMTKEVNPNLAAPPVGKITMTYDNANRIVTFNNTAVTYDADGNMTRGPVGPLGTPVFANFTWDSRNRLLSVTGGNAYVYDAENYRIQAGITRYVINPHVRLSQVLMEADASGTPSVWYVYGLGLIGREDASGYKTYHYDRRGSTVALSGGGGVVTDTYKYAAYGELVNHTGTAVQPFAYAGRDGVMDEGYGLSFARARYSSAATRRFLSRDTLMGSIASPATLNQFTLLDGSPMSGVDPTGMLSWSDFGNFASGMLDTASFVVKGVATVGICGSIGWNVGAGACVSTGAAALADLNDGAAKLGSVLDNVVIGVGQSADALLGTDAWTSVSEVTPDQTDYLGALGGSNSVIGKSLYVAMKANQMGHNLKDIYKGVRDVNLRQTWAQVKSLTSLNWHYATHGVFHLLDTYSDYARVLDNVKAATWDVYTTGADGLDLARYLFGGAGVRQPSTSTGVGSTMPICMQFSLSPHCSGKKGG